MRENYKELSIIADNLANLYDDGISISMCFELLLELHISKSYKNSLKVIREKILKGYSIADGFRECGDLYPAFFVGVISLGENSGELNKCLKNLGKYYYEINNMKQKVKGELRYPLFILFSFILFFISTFLFIIPNLYEAFGSTSKKVPKIIEVSYFASTWVWSNPIISLIALISWGIVMILLVKCYKEFLNKDFSKVLLRLNFVREYYEYIFILLLSVILSSGIQLTKGIRLCCESTDIEVIKNMLRNMNTEILKGNEISDVVKESCFLSKYTYSMISIGEKSGDLSSAIDKVRKRLESSILERLKKLVSVISPVSIISMSLLILIFIILFIMPMVDMIYSGYV